MRVLTGINTTGTLHLGNYCGAIRPCVQASKRDDVESFFFMADLHALIKCHDPDRIEKSRMQIAASWLACGLDPERVTFYRQSDIPEIPLLNWMLNCVCSKGLMNRAHAYKAFLEANQDAGEDPDAGVSMGLFCYPVLMAADILMFNADRVPVGRDQIQHLEMARDMATRFNNMYGRGKEFFVLPFEQIDENVEILPGLDGRKMSKSYNNVIPLFDGGEKALREAIGRIVTDSKLPGDPKDPQSTSLTRIYEAFATREEYDAFCQELRDGLGWGEAKKKLIDKINGEIGPMREKYEYYISHPAELEAILQADIIVIGPGSLYTSIIPNFLVDGICEAIRASGAVREYILNIMMQDGETDGYTGEDHVRALLEHAGGGLANAGPVANAVLQAAVAG